MGRCLRRDGLRTGCCPTARWPRCVGALRQHPDGAGDQSPGPILGTGKLPETSRKGTRVRHCCRSPGAGQRSLPSCQLERSEDNTKTVERFLTTMSATSFAKFQKLGRALMLPIAVLPVAGLLLRLGQPDLLNIKWLADAGGAIFTNLPLIFSIGVAVGFAKENHGAAALAGGIGYLILTAVLKSINDKLDMGVLAGILCGIVAGNLYNRFKDIKLPEYLAFFGGKRFVPIITGLVCVFLGLLCGYIWPAVQTGIDWVGHFLIGAGGLGLFIYGVLNRLLLVTGLHHILNSLVWFVFGSYTGADGKVVTGDLNRFFAGDQTAGSFMTGFFPIMMFGLPAACLAMYYAARPENRKLVGGMLLSMALTAFLTGVTEPVEFTFMFLAPILYVIHAILTGISMALMHFLSVRLGFTFSAGAFDYIISYRLGTNGWMLIPVGLVYFLIYYFLFSFAIRKFNLATPGRAEASVETSAEGVPALAGKQKSRAQQLLLPGRWAL